VTGGSLGGRPPKALASLRARTGAGGGRGGDMAASVATPPGL
jgi:hypothetical protein